MLAYFGGTHEGNKDVGIYLTKMEEGALDKTGGSGEWRYQ
ncbi:MAG: exo-alpha-sialidase [Chitinophagaceae bacterium]|nr:exo-alpha-sialidase [Chitinophagaceae bacterium]